MLAPNAVQPLSQVPELLPAASADEPAIACSPRAARLRRGLLRAGAVLLEGISQGAAMAFLVPPAGSFQGSRSARHRDRGATPTAEFELAALTAVGCRSEAALTVVGRYAPVPASRAFNALLAEQGEGAQRSTRRPEQ